MPDRYVVISADCHAGATMEMYRQYLDAGFVDEYDDWRKGFQNPFADLVDTTSRDYLRNFDNAVRQEDLEGDGVVAEVIFPNTIPPFFAGMMLFNGPDPTSRRELEQRWAGLHAHNRWLADFCAELPGRRAGVAQVLLDNVERAVEEVRWIREQPGLFGGVLVPNPNADSRVAPLHAPDYEVLWAAIEESGLPMNVHGGPGGPNLGAYPATPMMMFLEFGWYAQRPLVRLIFSGVLERHPRLKLVFTETGNRWVPGALEGAGHLLRHGCDRTIRFGGGHVRCLCPGEPQDAAERLLGAPVLSRRQLHEPKGPPCGREGRAGPCDVGWGLSAHGRNSPAHRGVTSTYLLRRTSR